MIGYDMGFGGVRCFCEGLDDVGGLIWGLGWLDGLRLVLGFVYGIIGY